MSTRRSLSTAPLQPTRAVAWAHVLCSLCAWRAAKYRCQQSVLAVLVLTRVVRLYCQLTLWSRWATRQYARQSRATLVGLRLSELSTNRPKGTVRASPPFVAERGEPQAHAVGGRFDERDAPVLPFPPLPSPSLPSPSLPFPSLPVPLTAEAPLPTTFAGVSLMSHRMASCGEWLVRAASFVQRLWFGCRVGAQ